MLKMLLMKKGIDCDTAHNGLEAVKMYKAAFVDGGARRAAVYDIIFMDHTMPLMVSTPISRILTHAQTHTHTHTRIDQHILPLTNEQTPSLPLFLLPPASLRHTYCLSLSLSL